MNIIKGNPGIGTALNANAISDVMMHMAMRHFNIVTPVDNQAK
jgi:hypothetical protein